MSEMDANIFCSFCDEGFASVQAIADHLLMCGNKTDQCPNCKKFIRRAIFAYHYENDCADPDAPTADDETHEKPNHSERPRVTIKCEFCQQNYDKIDRRVHKENCLRNPVNLAKNQQPFSDEDSNQNLDQPNDSDDDTLIPCEYCKRGIQWHLYETHTNACQDEEYNRLQKKPRSAGFSGIAKNFISSVGRRMNRNTIPTTATDPAPCVFCARSMSSSGLQYHQLHCTKNPHRNRN